jgi:hypothetical protein
MLPKYFPYFQPGETSKVTSSIILVALKSMLFYFEV